MSASVQAAVKKPDIDHAWMPSSPCGDGCIPRNWDSVHALTVLARVLAAVCVIALLPTLVLIGVLPPRFRQHVTRLGAQILLFASGIGLTVDDLRSTREASRTDGGALLVAGHVSWTDVLVLAAIRPATFVARADLVSWPVLGPLARSMKVLPIQRQNLRALPQAVDQVAARLRAGRTVVVFPEATTWCGRANGSFKPAMFQAAIDTETWVQPVRLRYVDRNRELTTATCFVGTETVGASISRILRLKGVVAEVVLAAPEPPGNDRRDLARRCEASARGTHIKTSRDTKRTSDAIRSVVRPSYVRP